PGHAARMLEALGQRHTDRIHLRCATRPLLGDDDILRCRRRIELDPVRAGAVSHPRHYRWSSYAGNASPVPDPLLQPHRAWLALGHDAAARQRAWVELVAAPVALPAQRRPRPRRMSGKAGNRHALATGCAGAVALAGSLHGGSMPWC